METENDERVFHKQLSKAFSNSGMTQEELAKKISVDRTTISHWVRGRHTPNPGQIKKLATALGVSTDFLMGLEKEDWFYALPPDLREFVREELISGNQYLRVADYAKKKRLSHRVIREITDSVALEYSASLPNRNMDEL